MKRRLRSELLTVGVVLGLGLSARSSLADHYHVPSGSMLPSVQVGDRVLVDKRAYGLRLPFSATYLLESEAPAPGEVVVLRSPESGITLLKRVAAVPGERVEVRAGRLIVEGRPTSGEASPEGLAEERRGERAYPIHVGGSMDMAPRRVPEGQFLLLGDNRPNSRDGRSFGLVPRGAIYGRVTGVYYSGGFGWTPL